MPQQKIITVFGGTGFIGRHVIYALARTGATIRVASRIRQRAYFLRPAGDPGQIVPIACNVRDKASVARALEGATHAVNLIGVLFEKGRKDSFDKIHREIPERIAQVAKEKNLDLLVHISSLGASQDAQAKYARSKAAGEGLLVHAFPKSVILRPGIVFGPEDEFFNRFARMAQFSPFIPLIGGGHTKLQPVYVGDIAEAVTHLIGTPDAAKHYGQIYELGGPRVYTFRELMEIMLGVTGQDVSLLTVPVPMAKILGAFASLLPNPVLTIDQVRSLEQDNIIAPHSPGLAQLNIEPMSLEAVLPQYLKRYRSL